MRKETGAVTILMALLMLLITTGVTLMVGAVVKNEIRNSSDDYREQVAYQAASSGIHFAMEYLSENAAEGDVDDETKLTAFGICETSNQVFSLSASCRQELSDIHSDNEVQGKFWVTFCKPDSEPTASTNCEQKTWDENDGRALIFARGQSDDGEANRYITAMASSLSAVKGSLAAPITGGNTVTVNGSASIDNAEGRSTVWSASTISFGNNKETKILAPEFTIAEGKAGKDADNNPTYMIVSSDYTKKGPDVIENDPTLATASLNDFAGRFLGTTISDFASRAKDALEATDADDTWSGYKGGLYYLTSDDPFQSENTQIGSVGSPAIIVLDPSSGTVDMSGNTEIYGIVFVTGAVEVTGNPNVYGGVVVYGAMSGSGNLGVKYDSDVSVPVPGEVGEVTLIGGSVKDWL